MRLAIVSFLGTPLGGATEEKKSTAGRKGVRGEVAQNHPGVTSLDRVR